jgi:DNA-binding transcriptional regulator YbjK
MNRLKMLLAILLIVAGATVVGVAGYRYSKSSAVKASPSPRVVAAVNPPESGLKEGGEDGKTMNLAATGKGEGGTKATSTLQGFRDRIMKAKAEKNGEKRMALLSEAIQTLNPSQIRETLAEVEAMKDYRLRSQLRGMLLSRWGESDPKAALAYAQGLGSSMENLGEIRSVMRSWGAKDFPAAKAWLEGLPAGPLRNDVLESLAFGLAQKDPAAALSLARSLPGDDGQRFLRGAINAWCLQDADAAFAYVAKLTADPNKPEFKKFLTLEMISTVAKKDPDKVISMLEQFPPEDQNNALRSIGYSWGQSDPKAALDWANQQPDPQVKSLILPGAIEALSEKDPNSALELAQSLPAGDSRTSLIGNVLYKLSESDPKGAVGYAMNLPSSENRNMMIRVMAVQWIRDDSQGALGWYGSLTDPKLKEQVAGSMINILSQDDPAKSLDLLDTMPPGFFQNQALSRIGRNWAQTDQKAALNWANQQTDPEVKSRILEGVIEVMSVKDPNSAFQLVQSLPAGNSRNRIIITSLGSMAQSDPQSAIALASGIANADLRSKAQQNVVRSWKRRDPTAANQWVNSSSLPQDVKTRLLQKK